MPPIDPIAIWATVVAVAVLLAPGMLIGASLGLRGIALVGLAGPLTIATVGLTGVFSAAVGIRFGWLSATTVAILAAIVAWGLRHRLRTPGWARGSRSAGLWLLGMVPVTAVVVLMIAFRETPIGAISQTYDAVFHLNATASILESGRASSFELYRLINPEGTSVDFYPAAWHSLVAITAQLSGSPIATATGATWLAATAAVWVPGSALLTLTFLGPRTVRSWKVVLPALLATCFSAFPYLLLSWGTLYPTGLATALLPSGIALLAFALPRSPSAFAHGAGPLLRRAIFPGALLLVWFTAAVFAHPRTLVSFAVAAAPLVVQMIVLGHRGLRRLGRPRAALGIVLAPLGALVVLATAAAAYLFISYDLFADPISNRLTGGPATAHQSLWESLLQFLLAAPISSPGEMPLPPAWPIAAAVACGAVLAFRSRRARPLVIALIAFGLLYCLAAGSNSDLAKVLTGAWYKDKYRLISVTPVFGVPLVMLVFAWIRSLPFRRRLREPAAAGVVLLIALLSWTGPTLTAMGSQIGRAFALPESDKGGALIDEDERRLLLEAGEIVPADQRILGNPWDGSSLVWAVGGREAVSPHLVGSWGSARNIVATRLDEVGTAPDVCAALDELRVRYLIADPQRLWDREDPQQVFFSGIDRAVESGTLHPVAVSGSTVLYRIDACGELAER